jgi:hypothetical protein
VRVGSGGGAARATGLGDAGLDVGGHLEEGLLDVGRRLGRRLDEGDAQASGEVTRLVGVDLAVRAVRLVADKELVDVVGRELVDLLQPVADVVERLLVRDVVDDDDAVRAAVVGGGDGAEALLAGRVPDLELDLLAVELEVADLEVDADGGDVRVSVRVVGEAEKKARLADAGIADEKKLEKVIVLSHFFLKGCFFCFVLILGQNLNRHFFCLFVFSIFICSYFEMIFRILGFMSIIFF